MEGRGLRRDRIEEAITGLVVVGREGGGRGVMAFRLRPQKEMIKIYTDWTIFFSHVLSVSKSVFTDVH